MTVAFQRMFDILERWNNIQVTPSLSKPHELNYRSNTFIWKLGQIRVGSDTSSRSGLNSAPPIYSVQPSITTYQGDRFYRQI